MNYGSTTNYIEGFFSICRRGIRGVYQFCSELHLHYYLAEIELRYSKHSAISVEATERADTLLRCVIGKRLTHEINARA